MLRKTPQISLLQIATFWLALLLWGVGTGNEQTAVAQSSASQPGYWVVSTYGMPQQPGECPGQLCFQCYHKTPRGPLQKSSLAHMQQSLDPQAPTCIFVHGSFVDFESALADAHHTYPWLRGGAPGCPLNVIFFVWPSSEAETILLPTMVIENGLKAAHNGTYLAYLMDYLPASSPLCLMGHSHGTRTIAAGLHFRAGGVIHGRKMNRQRCLPHRIRVVFAASAINHLWLNPDNRYGLALTQVEYLLNLINYRDAALTLYPLVSPTYGRAFAKSGVTIFDRRQLGPYAERIHELNVSPLVGVGHVWMNYFSQPEISRMVARYVFFDGKKGSDHQLVRAEITLQEMAAAGAPLLDTEALQVTSLAPSRTTINGIDLPLPESLETTEIKQDELPILPALPPLGE